jgi:hypothetical protein
MKLLLRQLTIQIHVTQCCFPFYPLFLFIASSTVNGRPLLETLHPVPILHHHHLNHGHIGTLDHPIVAGPVSTVAQGHQDIVCPSLPTIKHSNLPFSVKSTPNFAFKRTQRSLKLGGSSNHSNSSSISSNIPSSFLTLST